MTAFATLDDLTELGRKLTAEEQGRALALLEVVSATLRYEADKVGKDLDAMVAENENLSQVAKSVTVDVVFRTLNASIDSEPMAQLTQTAGPYSASGTYLVPGGGLFIKRAELARLGLRRQKYGMVDYYGTSQRKDDYSV